ncbi:hypothetical protein M0Q97_13725, partial [Candidatus Dojkabacteria bacterium]|nr:hypothetical protein [Candidatus Dojkabacteria bacterium]
MSNSVEEYNIDVPKYEHKTNIASSTGADEAKLKGGNITTSVINKLHLIKLAGDIKSFDNDNTLSTAFGRKNSKNITYKDLCLKIG